MRTTFSILLRLAVAAGLWLALTLSAYAEVRIASWNIQNFGWGENKDYHAVSRIASQFDIIAIQELMNAAALEQLQHILQSETGDKWSVMYSHRLGRGRYQEKYAFIWRDASVEYVDGAVVYLDNRDLFAREPYSARFRSRNSDLVFVLATVHITYGQRVGDRTPEIHALREYWDWLAEVYPENTDSRILLGDFNLRPEHPAWAPLTEVATALITSGATTLSSHDRQYANLYDNIFVPRAHNLPIGDVGILEFPILLSEVTGSYWSHEKARRQVSDHAPVYLLLGRQSLHPVHGASITTVQCIDLNTASMDELQAIIHVGEARAQAIVSGRPWSTVSDLTRVSGISNNRASEILQQGLVCQP